MTIFEELHDRAVQAKANRQPVLITTAELVQMVKGWQREDNTAALAEARQSFASGIAVVFGCPAVLA